MEPGSGRQRGPTRPGLAADTPMSVCRPGASRSPFRREKSLLTQGVWRSGRVCAGCRSGAHEPWHRGSLRQPAEGAHAPGHSTRGSGEGWHAVSPPSPTGLGTTDLRGRHPQPSLRGGSLPLSSCRSRTGVGRRARQLIVRPHYAGSGPPVAAASQQAARREAREETCRCGCRGPQLPAPACPRRPGGRRPSRPPGPCRRPSRPS